MMFIVRDGFFITTVRGAAPGVMNVHQYAAMMRGGPGRNSGRTRRKRATEKVENKKKKSK